MKLLHMGLKHTGVRFLIKMRKYLKPKLADDTYRYFFRKFEFLNSLNDRRNKYDVVLITAHGGDKAIVKDVGGRWVHYISQENVGCFINKCVITISCLTALQFGETVVDKGALAYLGYKKFVSSIFYFDHMELDIPRKKVITPYEVIIRMIYIEAFTLSLSSFLMNCETLKTFKARFSFNYEKGINKLEYMSCHDIRAKYNVYIDEEMWDRYRQVMNMKHMMTFDDINSSMVIHGDDSYRSVYGLEYNNEISIETIKKLLQSSFQDSTYDLYFKNKLYEYLLKKGYSDELDEVIQDIAAAQPGI